MAFLDFGIVAIIKPQDQAFAWQERCASHSFRTNTPGSERHQATSQTYVLNTQPKLVLLEHFPVSGSKLSWQNAQCSIAEEDLGWCQAKIIRTDSQTSSSIPGHTGGQTSPCFGTRDLAVWQLKSSLVQIASPVQRASEVERRQRDSGAGGFCYTGSRAGKGETLPISPRTITALISRETERTIFLWCSRAACAGQFGFGIWRVWVTSQLCPDRREVPEQVTAPLNPPPAPGRARALQSSCGSSAAVASWCHRNTADEVGVSDGFSSGREHF